MDHWRRYSLDPISCHPVSYLVPVWRPEGPQIVAPRHDMPNAQRALADPAVSAGTEGYPGPAAYSVRIVLRSYSVYIRCRTTTKESIVLSYDAK